MSVSRKRWVPWKWDEVAYIWAHPEMTAGELSEKFSGRHSEQAVRQQRARMGRYNPSSVPTCCSCNERPVWAESAKAKRYGLCKGCFLSEERRRLEEENEATAVRQLRKRVHGTERE